MVNQPTIEDIELSLESLAMTPAECELTPPRKTWEELISALHTAQSTEGISNWVLGDIGNEIEVIFKTEKDPTTGMTPLAQAAVAIGEKPASLQQKVLVSCRYPERMDRKTGLSWTHYRSAASADNPMDWINKAVDNGWTVSQLEAELKQAGEMKAILIGNCSVCGHDLTMDNARHIRFRNKKETSVCSVTCMFKFYAPLAQAEAARMAQTDADAETATAEEPAQVPMSVVSTEVPAATVPTLDQRRNPNHVPSSVELADLDGLGIFGEDVVDNVRNLRKETEMVGA